MKRLTAVFLVLSLALLSVMAPGFFAAAAEETEAEWGILDNMAFLVSPDAVKNAGRVLQRDLYTGTVCGTEFTVTEAGYDGHALFLRYRYQVPDTKNAFGVRAEEIYGEFLPEGIRAGSFVEGLTEEGSELREAMQIGWWCSQCWINGKPVALDAGASQSFSGTDVPGEIDETDYLPVYKSGVSLEGTVRISLPIDTPPDSSEYDPETHPENFDADGLLILPEKGVVTFELDTKDILSGARISCPEQETELPAFTAKTREAMFSPLLTYITVEIVLKPGALEAFLAEHGEGEINEDGELMFRYGPVNVFDSWLGSLRLVDGNGTLLFPDRGGVQGNDEQSAEFIYPAMENLPESLFLAPYDEEAEKADMDSAVRVK